MVCVAAFIILGLVGIFVALISIFRPAIGRAYWKVFHKSLGCVSKKVRFQKCDTNFKDDVKNTLLKKVILKRPDLVKPLSITIEILSTLFVIVFIWAVLTSIKALLALWVLGTCNVDRPASCTLSSEACSLGDDSASLSFFEGIGRWFTEWGDIFSAIPDRLKTWDAADYYLDSATVFAPSSAESSASETTSENSSTSEIPEKTALDLFDPGCSACLSSFRNQLSSGFFSEYHTALLLYPIELSEGEYKFPSSGLIARYYYALALAYPDENYAYRLIEKIFTEKSSDGILYQSVFNTTKDLSDSEELLISWLKSEFGLHSSERTEIKSLAHSAQVDAVLAEVKSIATDKIHITGIPTLIYDGQKHLGLYSI